MTSTFDQHTTWAEQIGRGLARRAYRRNDEDDAAQVALVRLWKVCRKIGYARDLRAVAYTAIKRDVIEFLGFHKYAPLEMEAR